MDGKSGRSGSKRVTSTTLKSQNQLEETSENETSEEVIEDVKVCDICGDAGLEELLAICSRCSDGAEHTYCMQKKLKELPEGEWLCEECKFKEETKQENADKSETVAGALGVQSLIKTNQNVENDSDAKCSPELDTKPLKPELETKPLNSVEKGASEKPICPQNPAKSEEDSLEADLKTREKVLESSDTSTRVADAKSKSLLREDSFSNLGADKAKHVKPVESGGQSVNNSFFARSHTFSGSNSSKMLEAFQSSRGPLPKSVSFNNSSVKPKVQFLGTIPSLKQNTSRESSDTRKGQIKKMSESSSLKSLRLGSSNAITKSQPILPLHAGEHRGLKERNMVEKKNAMPGRLGVNLTAGTAGANRDSKLGSEVDITSESKVLDVNRGLHDKDNLGCDEGKSSYFSKNFGQLSSLLTARKPCQPVASEDAHEVSVAADRSSGILNAPSPRTTTQGGSGILRCRKCNRTGHPTQFCSIDKLPVSALKPSADRNITDWHDRSDKAKDTTDAPILKSAVQKDSRLQNLSEKGSIPGANSSFDVSSKGMHSSSTSYLKNAVRMERTCGQDVVRSNIDDSGMRTACGNVSLQGVQAEASCVPREINSSSIVTNSNPKLLPHVLPNTTAVPADRLRSPVIPELEFIWQGGFEILRSGRLSRSCEGLQAHLSNCASPKVIEAATKFPCKVQLEEVTYLSSWPFQYQGHSPREHNIALFFFAKDVESYEKNYSKLLDNMIKNDLALKGNIPGAELLVFPSNKLPQNCQRWNRLFFLWGVFIGRRLNCSETPSWSREKELSEASLDLEHWHQNLPTPIAEASMYQKLNNNESKEISSFDKVTELKEVKSATYDNLHSITPGLEMIFPGAGLENKAISKERDFDSEGTEVQSIHDKNKMEDKGSIIKGNAFWGADSSELTDLRPNRKRSLRTAIETISHAAGSTSQCSGEQMPLNGKLDFPLVDDGREHKKMKPESKGHVGCVHREENFSSGFSSNLDSFSSRNFDQATIMPECSSSNASCLFPLELGPVRDAMLHKMAQPKDCEGSADVPNLELALGAKKKSSEEEISPLPSSDSGDDIAASLSLSLAFHPSNKAP